MTAVALPDPRIAIVVLTRNRREELRRTLERLVSLPRRYAIIVVDNGSEDGSADAIEREFPRRRCCGPAPTWGRPAATWAWRA